MGTNWSDIRAYVGSLKNTAQAHRDTVNGIAGSFLESRATGVPISTVTLSRIQGGIEVTETVGMGEKKALLAIADEFCDHVEQITDGPRGFAYPHFVAGYNPGFSGAREAALRMHRSTVDTRFALRKAVSMAGRVPPNKFMLRTLPLLQSHASVMEDAIKLLEGVEKEMLSTDKTGNRVLLAFVAGTILVLGAAGLYGHFRGRAKTQEGK